MLRRLWEWFWKAEDRRWTPREMQERVLALELEWSDVVDKLLARDDRERKRKKKALFDELAGEQGTQVDQQARTKDDLRRRLTALRGRKEA